MSRAEERAMEAYTNNYHQAEKDLALTWRDMMIIHKCIKYVMNTVLDPMDTFEGKQPVYQEVLKRFNGQRGKEI